MDLDLACTVRTVMCFALGREHSHPGHSSAFHLSAPPEADHVDRGVRRTEPRSHGHGAVAVGAWRKGADAAEKKLCGIGRGAWWRAERSKLFSKVLGVMDCIEWG